MRDITPSTGMNECSRVRVFFHDSSVFVYEAFVAHRPLPSPILPDFRPQDKSNTRVSRPARA